MSKETGRGSKKSQSHKLVNVVCECFLIQNQISLLMLGKLVSGIALIPYVYTHCDVWSWPKKLRIAWITRKWLFSVALLWKLLFDSWVLQLMLLYAGSHPNGMALDRKSFTRNVNPLWCLELAKKAQNCLDNKKMTTFGLSSIMKMI